jgi:hypothetical protein
VLRLGLEEERVEPAHDAGEMLDTMRGEQRSVHEDRGVALLLVAQDESLAGRAEHDLHARARTGQPDRMHGHAADRGAARLGRADQPAPAGRRAVPLAREHLGQLARGAARNIGLCGRAVLDHLEARHVPSRDPREMLEQRGREREVARRDAHAGRARLGVDAGEILVEQSGRTDHHGYPARECEGDVATHHGRVRVVDEHVRPSIQRALDVVVDGYPDGLTAERLADIAAALAARDGRVQHHIVGADDGRDELAADRAESAREADVEWPGGDGTAGYMPPVEVLPARVSISAPPVCPIGDHADCSEEEAMKFMLLIHQGTTPTPRSPDEWARLSEDEQNAVYAAYRAVNETPGVTPGLQLADPEVASTVRVQDGKTLITDGPFAEIKEAVGGYLHFEADDLDAAIALAARIPAARMGGAVEVRPIVEW